VGEPIYRRLSVSSLFLISVLGLLLTACVSKPSAPEPASIQVATAPTSSATGAKVPPIRPPECPKFGSFPEPSDLPSKGEHTVVLSWKASAPADAKHTDAFGYCIYRGEKRNDRSLVRVNLEAFRGTSCTDDMVQTGKTYYYKVKAISAKRNLSDTTDFVKARILDQKPANPVASPPPLCRMPSSK
jgi:hypothetical protein